MKICRNCTRKPCFRKNANLIMFIDKIEFCTFITYGTGLCNGDSGSGLIRNSDNTIVGLVPDGISCAECYPDIYTNVYSYVS
ncbi:PREDICTED: chymotrypsin-2-like [Acromyrmex echinatior]|uniref:chymotrypsin-2-like n=1 Tax=Acromyrmex echinatior TaxID=103372 RepID=UPI000580EEEE|nr:PREDICTED: chymotrypsin-2-like [Acromyrmex echinatior]